jgi:NAD(P)H dehydrogenase (quinone)
MTRVIAVTGATGTLGGRVARWPTGRDDVTLRVVVREAARAPRLPRAQVATAAGGYADGPGLTAALEGAHTL